MKFIYICLLPLLLFSCLKKEQSTASSTDPRNSKDKTAVAYRLQDEISIQVPVDHQTDPVDAKSSQDSADDIAIWVDDQNPEHSRIIGTHKKYGLYLFEASGKKITDYPFGKINNVDVRQGVVFGQDTLDIVAGSNRTDNSILWLQMRNDALLKLTDHAQKVSPLIDDAYGFCLYHDLKNQKLYAFVNGKNGNIEQYLLNKNESGFTHRLVRRLKVDSQPEGMVVDDRTHRLYIGEENVGVWYADARAEASDSLTMIAQSRVAENQFIVADIEGLAIYPQGSEGGLLFLSIQGNFSYAVFDLQTNKYINSFKLTDGLVDGVEETDGIELTTAQLIPGMDRGVLIAQDGFNMEQDSMVAQNFKLVSVGKILEALSISL